MLHLDNEYRNKREEYITPNKIYDSREINWREVPWNNVQEIKIIIKNNEYSVTNSDPRFKAFIKWRWGGKIAQFDEEGNPVVPKKINIWCIGWTDGVICYMTEIDFHTGKLDRECEYLLDMFKSHIHKDIKGILDG